MSRTTDTLAAGLFLAMLALGFVLYAWGVGVHVGRAEACEWHCGPDAFTAEWRDDACVCADLRGAE